MSPSRPPSRRDVATIVNPDRCIGCGRCVQVCPSRTLSLVADKARVTGRASIRCGHCQAVCPTGAVTVSCLDPDTLRFARFQLDDAWLPHGQGDVAGLVRLMASRRSCRNFKPDAVDLELLRDLVKIGCLAPSGTNSQRWTFTLLPRRGEVERFAHLVAGFFEKLNAQARKTWLRKGLSLVGKGELEAYFQGYYPSVARALREWKEEGLDRLFHGAPAAMVVSSSPGASCPAEDALLATQNILLGAHALGLGTCLIGYAVAAMARDASVKTGLGIPAEETPHAVIALGWPDETYARVVPRLTPLVRVLGGETA